MVINLPTDTKQLILTEDNDVLTITLNNPQYKNALSEELTPYLRTILKKLKKQNRYKLKIFFMSILLPIYMISFLLLKI